MDTDHIDQLLERYLALLDEYTVLRELLGKTQAGMYQNIARANFSAERGVRYGPDYYDERMQASRTLSISVSEGDKGIPRFELVKPTEAVTNPETHETPGDEGKPGTGDEAPVEKAASEKAKKSNDPLRWFGILAPLPLRQAQALSVKAVEDVIPRLVSVNAEMMNLEIEVRRARKRRAKAEVAHKKIDGEDVQETEQRESQAFMTLVEST
ncbi:uncharacterized protein CTRU02_212629 [Colletotrichum truncatum]|uniref:Uncharacterized protein n=1 Tax=Colletotrichum truncatum TaxID=5467 RepID=A0ACC3YIG2_COLTU|nr:uncharacterized protein CTRU02_05298 [Colletotrichum truncatum]KAF6794466.1 hypothetical protein CTRU02_05298 [Colletotrichum truncatum]